MIINEDTKLDIYNSKRKNSADDTMVSPGITDRFEDDVANDEGDWGNTQKKYAPGPTYEEDKMAEYKDNPRFKKKCPASNGKHDWEWVERKGKMFGSCDNCGAEHPQNKKLKEEIVIDNLLRAVLMEAQSFDPQSTEHTEDPITACSVCGVKGHVPAKHFGRALAGENNQPVKEAVTKKKQLLFGDEKPREVKCIKCKGKFTYTPKDSVEMRQLCDTCGKKPLKEGMKFSRQHDTPEKAEAHKTSLMKQGVKAWVNHSPDGTHHTFWMQEDGLKQNWRKT